MDVLGEGTGGEGKSVKGERGREGKGVCEGKGLVRGKRRKVLEGIREGETFARGNMSWMG